MTQEQESSFIKKFLPENTKIPLDKYLEPTLLITIVVGISLLLGGLIFLIYFAHINFMPQVNIQSSLALLATAAITGGIVFLVLCVSSILPAVVWFFKVIRNEELKSMWFKIKNSLFLPTVKDCNLRFIFKKLNGPSSVFKKCQCKNKRYKIKNLRRKTCFRNERINRYQQKIRFERYKNCKCSKLLQHSLALGGWSFVCIILLFFPILIYVMLIKEESENINIPVILVLSVFILLINFSFFHFLILL